MAITRNTLPADWKKFLCAGLTCSVLALGTAHAQTATDAPAADAPKAEAAAAPADGEMTEGQREAAEGAKRLAAGEEDDPHIGTAPKPDANRVYVQDPAHFAAITQQFIVDGSTGIVLGMTDGGFLPAPVVSDDGSTFGQVSTVFERIARGKRTDYVEMFDPETLLPVADIELPNAPRFLVGTYPQMSTLTPDNKTLLFYQFSPAPAVGVVNLAEKKFDRMVDVPDCTHIFPTDNDTFYMHCRDGSMAKINIAEAEPKITHSDVFHGEEEYLVNHPAFSMKAKKIIWPTYTGKTFVIDLSGDQAKVGEPIEVLTADEIKDGWKPGGWQLTAYSRAKDRFYVLVDQRAEWTHKTPSRFVVVVDAKTGKRINKLELGHDIDSINVTQNPEGTFLYGLSTGDSTLYVYDEETGKELRSINELGRGPQVLTVADMEP